tara:strand:+ start:13285 stop:13620 length:336 start_codon:yes stop_codon:yes gene_type:complete
MAITHTIADDTLVSIDPADVRGPWTIEFPPAPLEGDAFIVRSITRDETMITFDGNGRMIEFTEEDTSALTIPLSMNGRSLSFSYAVERDAWIVTADLSPRSGLAPQPVISA